MPTPDEIEIKTFAVTLRGFDQTEVTRFLHDIAAQLQSAIERADSLEAGTVFEEATRAAAEIMAKAEADAHEVMTAAQAEAEELKTAAEKLRGEASRIRADALALSERELDQTTKDCERIRLKAADDVESILTRADAEVSALLRAFHEGRDEFLGIGRIAPLTPRTPRKGSQRQLGQ
jgi:DivIVA domain-containing protein